LFSRAGDKAVVLLLALLLGACARPAPALPPDLSSRPAEQRLLPGDAESAEAGLDCPGLALKYQRNKEIAAKIDHSQGVPYLHGIGWLSLPLTIKTNSDLKKILDEMQLQRDRIDRLSKAKGCPSS
jgi:hypothetical protein